MLAIVAFEILLAISNPARAHAAEHLITSELRQSDVIELHSGELVVTRSGSPIGFPTDAEGRQLHPPLAVLGMNTEGPLLQPFHDARHVAIYTDWVALSHEPDVARARQEARDFGCWSTAYTPELCCPQVGWDDCFGEQYTFASCCTGWRMTRDEEFLWRIRTAFENAQMLLQETQDPDHQFYIHALILADVAANLEPDERGEIVLAEIGVDEAAFSKYMLSELMAREGVRVGRYYAVDPWQFHGSYGSRQKTFVCAAERLSKFWPIPRMIQETSALASRLVANGSVHVVFVDAEHEYEPVLEHLRVWWPKVRMGGVIAGHDYAPEKPERYPGTVRAVKEFAAQIGADTCLVGIPGTSFAILKTERCFRSEY